MSMQPQPSRGTARLRDALPRLPHLPRRLREVRGCPEGRRRAVRQGLPCAERPHRRHGPQADRARHREVDLGARAPRRPVVGRVAGRLRRPHPLALRPAGDTFGLLLFAALWGALFGVVWAAAGYAFTGASVTSLSDPGRRHQVRGLLRAQFRPEGPGDPRWGRSFMRLRCVSSNAASSAPTDPRPSFRASDSTASAHRRGGTCPSATRPRSMEDRDREGSQCPRLHPAHRSPHCARPARRSARLSRCGGVAAALVLAACGQSAPGGSGGTPTSLPAVTTGPLRPRDGAARRGRRRARLPRSPRLGCRDDGAGAAAGPRRRRPAAARPRPARLVAVCAYPTMRLAGRDAAHRALRPRRSGPCSTRRSARAVVDLLTWSARWNGRERACTAMAGDETAYLVGATYDDAIVWVAATADANACSRGTNGDFVTGDPVGVPLAAMLAGQAMPDGKPCDSSGLGRLDDDRTLAPEGSPLVTVCRLDAQSTWQATQLDAARSAEVVALLRSLPTQPTDHVCEGSGDSERRPLLARAAVCRRARRAHQRRPRVQPGSARERRRVGRRRRLSSPWSSRGARRSRGPTPTGRSPRPEPVPSARP